MPERAPKRLQRHEPQGMHKVYDAVWLTILCALVLLNLMQPGDRHITWFFIVYIIYLLQDAAYPVIRQEASWREALASVISSFVLVPALCIFLAWALA